MAAGYQHRLRSGLFGLAAFTVIGLTVVLFSRAQGFGWILLNLVLLSVFGFVTTILHELGHALTARLVGMRVHGVRIGAGPTFWKTRLLGVPVEFRMFALGGGTTLATHPTLEWLRLKHAAFVLAGPMTNLVVAVILIGLLDPATAQSSYPKSTELYPIMVFFAANLLVFVVNLIPRRFATEDGAIASDGLQLLRLPFWKPSDFSSQVGAHYLILGAEHIAAKDYINGRDVALIGLRACDRPEQFRAYLLNQVAWCDLLLGSADLLGEAVAYATEALQILPDNAAIKGTLGSIMVESGQYERGVDLLLVSNAGAVRNADRALNLCHIAMAHQRMGDSNKARDLLREIEMLDPNCPLLERARQQAGAGPAHAGC